MTKKKGKQPEAPARDAPEPEKETSPRTRTAHEASSVNQVPGAELDPPREATIVSRAATSAITKLMASAGIVAAMLLAVLVNVYVARHYKRWDWTKGGLYTLSDATLQTLHTLEEPVQIYVLLSSGDPLTISVRHLLEAYQSETTRIDVKFTDPDRDIAAFLAVQQRFSIVPGRTEDGRIVTDAVIVIVARDKPHFLTSRDLVQIDDEDDLRARPRLEQALTAGLRSVLKGDRAKACFTTGHGEQGLDDQLSALKERLTKNNYDAATLASSKEAASNGAGDTTSADLLPLSKIATCQVVVVARPTSKVPPEDVAALKAYVEGGGNALIVVGQVPEGDEERYLELGLGDLLAVGGVKLNDDFIFERDPDRRSRGGAGETFLPIAKPHAITEGLIKSAEQGQEFPIVMTIASSLSPTGTSTAAPLPLLVTSENAFGMVDFFTWAKNPSLDPEPLATDHRGPLTVAFATELPKRSAKGSEPSAHGSRIVVLSSISMLSAANWRDPQLRGTALFVESAISWLAARPVNLDIPNKPLFTAGLRITEEARSRILLYVVVCMPLASVLLGVAVHLRRRSTERRGKPAPPTRGGARTSKEA